MFPCSSSHSCQRNLSGHFGKTWWIPSCLSWPNYNEGVFVFFLCKPFIYLSPFYPLSIEMFNLLAFFGRDQEQCLHIFSLVKKVLIKNCPRLLWRLPWRTMSSSNQEGQEIEITGDCKLEKLLISQAMGPVIWKIENLRLFSVVLNDVCMPKVVFVTTNALVTSMYNIIFHSDCKMVLTIKFVKIYLNIKVNNENCLLRDVLYFGTFLCVYMQSINYLFLKNKFINE